MLELNPSDNTEAWWRHFICLKPENIARGMQPLEEVCHHTVGRSALSTYKTSSCYSTRECDVAPRESSGAVRYDARRKILLLSSCFHWCNGKFASKLFQFSVYLQQLEGHIAWGWGRIASQHCYLCHHQRVDEENVFFSKRALYKSQLFNFLRSNRCTAFSHRISSRGCLNKFRGVIRVLPGVRRGLGVWVMVEDSLWIARRILE